MSALKSLCQHCSYYIFNANRKDSKIIKFIVPGPVYINYVQPLLMQ